VSNSWQGKSRGGVMGYKIFILLLKHVGLSFAYGLLYFVALYFFLFSPKSFKNAFHFYYKKIGKNFFNSILAIYNNYYAFGEVLLDKTAMLAGISVKFNYVFEGENLLRESLEENKGLLLISAHMGNFEMAGHLLNRLNADVYVLMLDAEHEKIKNYLADVTKKSYKVIPLKDDMSHLYTISKAIDNKGIICMHGDRFIKGNKTMKFPFLKEDANFPAGPFYLAAGFEIPVSFVFAMKESKNLYHFYASKPRTYSKEMITGSRKERIELILKDYVSLMEKMIIRYPLQWFNFYNFWAKNENS